MCSTAINFEGIGAGEVDGIRKGGVSKDHHAGHHERGERETHEQKKMTTLTQILARADLGRYRPREGIVVQHQHLELRQIPDLRTYRPLEAVIHVDLAIIVAILSPLHLHAVYGVLQPQLLQFDEAVQGVGDRTEHLVVADLDDLKVLHVPDVGGEIAVQLVRVQEQLAELLEAPYPGGNVPRK